MYIQNHANPDKILYLNNVIAEDIWEYIKAYWNYMYIVS